MEGVEVNVKDIFKIGKKEFTILQVNFIKISKSESNLSSIIYFEIKIIFCFFQMNLGG